MRTKDAFALALRSLVYRRSRAQISSRKVEVMATAMIDSIDFFKKRVVRDDDREKMTIERYHREKITIEAIVVERDNRESE